MVLIPGWGRRRLRPGWLRRQAPFDTVIFQQRDQAGVFRVQRGQLIPFNHRLRTRQGSRPSKPARSKSVSLALTLLHDGGFFFVVIPKNLFTIF